MSHPSDLSRRHGLVIHMRPTTRGQLQHELKYCTATHVRAVTAQPFPSASRYAEAEQWHTHFHIVRPSLHLRIQNSSASDMPLLSLLLVIASDISSTLLCDLIQGRIFASRVTQSLQLGHPKSWHAVIGVTQHCTMMNVVRSGLKIEGFSLHWVLTSLQ
jgi:hypothetical protein